MGGLIPKRMRTRPFLNLTLAGCSLLLTVFCLPIHAVTAVRVAVNQPPPLEIVGLDLFAIGSTDIQLGDGLRITGGMAPYGYAWMANNQLLGSSLQLTVPFSTNLMSVYLKVVDANNCTCVRAIDPTGLDDVTASEGWLVSPNPAKDHLLIEPKTWKGGYHALLYDAQGRLVLFKTLSGRSIIRFTLPAGLYVLRLEEEGTHQTCIHKIILL
jgi:hypothetical protein